jgi:hypothetical protein
LELSVKVNDVLRPFAAAVPERLDGAAGYVGVVIWEYPIQPDRPTAL